VSLELKNGATAALYDAFELFINAMIGGLEQLAHR
jgi:hypothetical protein